MKHILTLALIISSFCCSFAQTESEQGKKDDLRRRAFIEDFLQTYQSAYEMKKIDYIEKFFSADALIITETKELNSCGSEMIPYITKKRPYKLIVSDKQEYIKRLRSVFEGSTRIKLSMSGQRIVKHSLYPEIYGVSFMQMWMSDNGEENIESQMPGYIFLMIDFKSNEMQPTVHVRTWQPKDNIRKPQDKFNLNDFVIYEFE